MLSSQPPEPLHANLRLANLVNIQQLKQWFDRVSIIDFRKLEQTRKSTVNTIIVATVIFSLLLGGLLFLGWILIPKNDGNSLEYIWFDFYQILAAIFLGMLTLGWLFITLVGGAIDNYRLGWRSQIVRKIIDFIDSDRVMTYVGESDNQHVRQSLLHSGIISNPGDDLIYIDTSDAIAIRQQNIRVSWSNVRASIPTTSLLSALDRLSQIIYEGWGIKKIIKLNFISLFVKVIRTVIYLCQCAIHRQVFDCDNFSRQVIGNEAGRKTIFQGILCQILLPDEDELGQAIVFPKQSKNQFVLAEISDRVRNMVKLNDPEFDRVFMIYSSDRETPKQILSPLVTRILLDYYRNSSYPIYLSINEKMGRS